MNELTKYVKKLEIIDNSLRTSARNPSGSDYMKYCVWKYLALCQAHTGLLVPNQFRAPPRLGFVLGAGNRAVNKTGEAPVPKSVAGEDME